MYLVSLNSLYMLKKFLDIKWLDSKLGSDLFIIELNWMCRRIKKISSVWNMGCIFYPCSETVDYLCVAICQRSAAKNLRA